MTQKYSSSELWSIGRICQNRLPPISTVQAMFLYELQRETEMENLFQGQLFRISKDEKHVNFLHNRIDRVEKELETLELQPRIKRLERLEAHLTGRIEDLFSKLHDHEYLLHSHTTRLQPLEEQNDRTPTCPAADPPFENVLIGNHDADAIELITLRSELETAQTTIAALDDHIGILFDERDALAKELTQTKTQLDEINTAMQKLQTQTEERLAQLETMDMRILSENKLRFAVLERAHVEPLCQTNESLSALRKIEAEHNEKTESRIFDLEKSVKEGMKKTQSELSSLWDLFCASVRQSAISGIPASSSTQRLPVLNADGKRLDLAVPKGKPLVTIKDAGLVVRDENTKPNNAAV